MIKKIQNVYDYIDYRILLTEDFMLRSTGNHKYSLRAYSRDLDLAPSFLSDIMRGKKELSPQKGRDTFSKIGFQLEELDYVENLIAYRSTKDPATKMSSLDFIRSKFKKGPLVDNKEKSLIVKSADHFILHGIIGCTSAFSKITVAAETMGISIGRTKEVLDEMTLAQYFETKQSETETHYFLNNMNLNVPDHEDLLATQVQFVQRLVKLIEDEGGLKPPASIANYFAFGLDNTTLPLAAEAYKQLVNTLNRLSIQTPVAERYAFYSSTFYTTVNTTLPQSQDKNSEAESQFIWPSVPV